jgi:chromosome segregation ATPase
MRVEGLNRVLEAELQDERDRLKTIENDLESVQHARTQAERSLAEAELAHQGALGALTTQLQTVCAELAAERAEVAQLKNDIDAEKAARAKLVDALRTVQRAVSFGEAMPASRPSAEAAPAPAIAAPKSPEESAEEASVARPLKLVSSKAPATEELELVEYLQNLFKQIQAIYNADLESGEDSPAVVDRLTANLRHAQNVFARRLQASNAGNPDLFEEQFALLLDAHGQTSFGRHLAVAAYSSASSVRAEAS